MSSGFSLPLAFKYNFYGKKYREIDLYFAYEPVSDENLDLLDTGSIDREGLNYLVEKNCHGDFDALIPYKLNERGKYDAEYGVRFKIGLEDENPTTATLLDRIGLMPCKRNNLSTLLKVFSDHDFYIEIEKDKNKDKDKRNHSIFINIKDGDDYLRIPAQFYSPPCWPGYAHSSITFPKKGHILKYKDIKWEEVVNDLQ